MNKRALPLLLTLMLLSTTATAQEQPAMDVPLLETTGENLPEETIVVRGKGERSDRWITGVTKSLLSIYLPKEAVKPTAAVVICPGGGYGGLAYDKEGVYVARWMAQRGIVAGVLKYRVGGGANQHPAPLSDAQLAMQTLRSKADELGYPADQIGVMGFSAGGHLAATTATIYSKDTESGISSRPDFAILVYPVVSMELTTTHRGSHRNLLGENASEELIKEMSADQRVTKQTPPTLMIHAVDDGAVSVENCFRFMTACKQHKVPAELHVYQTGGHGFGMWRDEDTISTWPAAMETWLEARRIID